VITGDDTLYGNSSSFTIKVRPSYGVDILCEPNIITIDPNLENFEFIERSFNITLTNNGNSIVDVDLDWSTTGIPFDWVVDLEKDVELLPLDPIDGNEDEITKTVSLKLTIPKDTPPGEYQFTLESRINSEEGRDLWEGVENISIFIVLPDVSISGEGNIVDELGNMISGDNPPITSSELKLSFNISNLGVSQSMDNMVRLTITHLDTLIKTEMEVPLEAIPVGQVSIVEFKWTPMEPGVYQMSVEVDPNDEMIESDEGNNERSTNIEVQEVVEEKGPDDDVLGAASCFALIAIGFIIGFAILYVVKRRTKKTHKGSP